MRRKRKQICLIILFVVVVGFLIKFMRGAKSLYEALSCDENRGKQLLQTMCMFYRNGRAAGNLCEDFCNMGLLVIDECLSHKNDNVIFSAKWKGRSIILKTKKQSSSNEWEDAFPDSLNQNLAELRENFLTTMYNHVINELARYKSTKEHHLKKHISPNQMLSQLYFNVSSGFLGRKEMQSLWSLVQQDEFFKMQLLQEHRYMPRIYGTCWQFYALEQVKTLDSFSGLAVISKLAPWRTRVMIAIGLLQLVHELNTDSLYGSWQHCDIQPSNFGVAKNGVVKVIDADLMFTSDKTVEMLKQDSVKCKNDQDCDFFDCVSQCDHGAMKCSSNRLSNNLQVVCRDLLAPAWIEGGLLSHVPGKSKAKFDTILSECSAQGKKSWSRGKYFRIYNTLITYLTNEMATNAEK